ncbi:MAG: hypothetical protein ACE5PV_15230 [Candidatus Poribacteria bacterium]
MAKMRPGQCKKTRKGVRYCYLPGVGVRFVSGGTSGLGQPTGQRCIRYKTIRTKTGKRVKRCAEFADIVEVAGPGRIRRCVAYKTGPSGQRRCARYRPI